MIDSKEALEESRSFIRTLLILTILVFTVTEIRSIVLIVQGNGLRLDAFRVWSLPLILSIPFVAGIRYYKAVEGRLVPTGCDPRLVLRIRSYLLVVTSMAYVAAGAVFSALDYAKR